MVEEIFEKAKEAFEAGYEVGTEIDKATGASDKWSDAAVEANPERAKEAADAWDRGDHLEAVGMFAESSLEAAGEKLEDAGEAVVDFVSDIFD